MKLFLDTEFTGLSQFTTLISIGIIAENGRTFYAEFTDYDKSMCDDWIYKNVISNLVLIRDNPYYNTNVYGDTKHVTKQLVDYLNEFELKEGEKLEIWSDCLAYDWVLFNELFGGALSIPSNVYYIPFDICTLMKIKDVDPDINREEFSEVKVFEWETMPKHNALWDARIIQMCYNKLMEM